MVTLLFLQMSLQIYEILYWISTSHIVTTQGKSKKNKRTKIYLKKSCTKFYEVELQSYGWPAMQWFPAPQYSRCNPVKPRWSRWKRLLQIAALRVS